MTTVQRCEMTDLPAGQCGGACCRPDLAETPFVPIAYDGTYREAGHRGRCGCGCGQPIEEGDDIVLADLDGDGVRDAWCLPEHTRSPGPW